MILVYLTKHDLSTCLRVSKAFYQTFIEFVWHTFEITEDKENIDVFRDIYGSPSSSSSTRKYERDQGHFSLSSSSTTGTDTPPSLLKLLPSPPLYLSLEKLEVDLCDDPGHYDSYCSTSERIDRLKFNRDLGVRALLQILERSTSRLLDLTIDFDHLTTACAFEDQARIMAALPSSLIQLSMSDYSGNTVPQSEEEKILDRVLSNRLSSPPSLSMPPLDKLKKLSLSDLRTGSRLLWTLVFNRCTTLEELHIDGGCGGHWDDLNLARMITKIKSQSSNRNTEEVTLSSSLKGLRTLGFNGFHMIIGRCTMAAILEHCDTLENLRIGGGYKRGEDDACFSTMLQRLLCSAPKLKRFDMVASEFHRDLEPLKLMAVDIASSSSSKSSLSPLQNWVCLQLESFKCGIGGVPRTDLKTRLDGSSLASDLHDPTKHTTLESQNAQRRILKQLGRLTSLREITLGQDNVHQDDVPGATLYSTSEARNLRDQQVKELGHSYDCLSLTLEDGLDQLSQLKNLRRVNVFKMSHAQGPKEQHWKEEHWPEFEQKEEKTGDGSADENGSVVCGDSLAMEADKEGQKEKKDFKDAFWTERGHWVNYSKTSEWGNDRSGKHEWNFWDWW
ncbi:hypothetical protein BGZ83_011349 [Gryganskiella cystojenkinii]|nr:hypothetical protein BGZ83_011349 [Gryganskiella cystojenkinii]